MILRKLTAAVILSLTVSGLSISQIKIGIALPLMKNSDSEADKATGEQILKGINEALSEYKNSGNSVKVDIRVEDTKKDPKATLDAFNRFGSDSSIIAVFGPVFSIELANNAGAAAFHKMPVITPTATQNFLAEKNPYVFQLNPTYDIRGRLMAEYAMNKLGMKNFLILSESGYGKNFAESFFDEIKIKGGYASDIDYYSSDSQSFTSQIEKLKDKIFEKDKFIDFGNLTPAQKEIFKKINFKFSNADSLSDAKLIVSIYRLFGKNADKICDSLKLTPVVLSDKSLFEKGTIIPGYYDAVYIPVSGFGEISTVAPAYFSSQIKLPLLGTSDWNNEKALSDNKAYIKEIYFDSDFYIEGNSDKSERDTDDSEIRNYYFGYDGMKMLLDQISEGNKTREKMNEALENLKYFKSAHNGIIMKGRTNHNMSVMSFRNGTLKKETDFELTDIK